MIRTSNFETCANHPDAVSIAGWPPPWFTGKQYKKLAPKRWFFDDYKRTGDSNVYIKHFNAEVLAQLDHAQVVAELGPNAIMLCYEKVGAFCHRRLVAAWLEKHLKITVPEFIHPHSLL